MSTSSSRINVGFKLEDMTEIESLAKEEGRSLANMVRILVKEALTRRKGDA